MSVNSERSFDPDTGVSTRARSGELSRAESDAVAAFSAAWKSTRRPPTIAEFLPDATTLRREALLGLIRVDLRHRWLHRPGAAPERAARMRLADYCAEFPELESDDIPAGLVYEEFVIRRQSGERVDPRECLSEYPRQAEELRELLNADELDQSTRRATLDDSTRTALAHPGSDLADTALNQTAESSRDSEMTRTTAADPMGTATVVPTTIGTGPVRYIALDRIEIGQRIDDFDLLTGLGSGAFARVFLARQRSLQRLVAVKISADHGTEPQTLAQLDHDYIVRVFDQRLLDDAEGAARRLRLLYMQFLPGGTLLGVLRWVRATPPAERSGQLLLDAVDVAMEEKGEIRPTDSSVRAELARLSWPETVAWLGRRLAEALDYASSHGVLHRDVKPANVLLTAEGVPKLADFNISFSRNVEGTSPVAYFGGSLAYMSPEQLEACHPSFGRNAADLDTRADIYSLGVVLWELLTGAKPFDDSTAGAGRHGDDTTLEAMLERRSGGVDAAALERVPPDCPAALRRVLLTCLAPERADRWSSGALLARQLKMCLDARARELVDPAPNSWRRRLRPYIVPVALVAVALPNVLASLYNIQHNQHLIISRMTENAQQTFLIITGTVNAIFFPAGIALVLYMARYVLTVPRGLRKGRRYDPQTLQRARRDALLMGDRAVAVAFSLWVLAGLIFPLALQVSTGDISARAIVHFFSSLVVCGAIAVAYPFFLLTFYMVRCIYPLFLRHGDISPADAVWLRGLDRRCNGYLAVAASVPLLAVAGVTFLPPSDIPSVIFAVRLLCVGGILAFVGTYLLFRALEADLRALERVVDPEAAGQGPPEVRSVRVETAAVETDT
ncbi:serine/threonine protein kinase [Nocardia abscessus]|uniref:Serine/threonine protein kinase n=1 Tax=Nocardia abscessus TaxID=120957 RepID=A0ABS0CHS3_9NOCA|nr:serine/threonine-protein kinase [Nocardia abscessus]MBF6229053.1 serine/threonine protein kinase [Nocardia abscessus]